MTFIVYKPLFSEHSSFTDAKVIDFVEAESYTYKKHWCSIGSFTLVVPNSVIGLELIKPDMLLLVLDEYVNDSLIITSVKDDGLHTTIRGYDCKLMLKWRITLFPQEEIEAGTYGYDVATGTTGQIIKHYIDYNAGTDAAAERQIYGLVCGNMASGIAEDTYMSRMQPLNEVVEALCENADIGYSVDIVREGENVGYVVTAFAGTDRTNSQTENTKVVFADYTFSTNNITAETNTEERKNLIWAINGGTVDDATVTAVNNSEEEEQPAGFLRREIVTTVNCETEDVEIYAKKDADGYTDKTEVNVEAAIYSDYGTRYLIGDLATVMKNGVAYDKRILSAEKSYSGQNKRVMITLGDIPEKRVIERLNYETSKNKYENITQRLDNRASSGAGTGKWLDDDHTSVAHNDLENNTSEGMYDNVDGYDNQLTGPSTISQNGNLSNGGNTVTGQHNRLTNCTDTLVSGRRNILSNAYDTIVIGDGNNVTSAMCSIICGGLNIVSSLIIGVVISGRGNTVTANDCGVFGKGHSVTREDSLTCGEYADNTNYMFAIGNGNSSTSRSNSFTIDYSGNVRAAGTITPNGADYAEYFEWADGNPENEDRRGMLVTLDGDRIIPAHGNEFIGVISANPSVVGNNAEMHWHGKYEQDVFGCVLYDEAGKPIISDDYKEQKYVPRSERAEWGLVGLVGRLVIVDDGSCKAGGYVSARRGVGTSCYCRTNARVLRRIDDTHIEVLIK